MADIITKSLAGGLIIFLLLSLFFHCRKKSVLSASEDGLDVSSIPRFDLLGAGAIIFLFSLRFFNPPPATTPAQDPTLSVYIAGAFSLILPALCIYFFRLKQPAFDKLPGWSIGKEKSVFYKLAWLPFLAILLTYIFGLIYTSSGLMEQIALWTNSTDKQNAVLILQDNVKPLSIRLFIAANAIIVAPLVEETIFRGYLYPILKKFTGFIPALIFTSLFFGLIHVHLPALLPLSIFGLLLVILYEKTKTLWAPIIAHCTFNLLTVAVSFAGLGT